VSGAGEGQRRWTGTAPMLAIAAPGLIACVLTALMTSHENLLSPLTLSLAVCVVIGTFVSLDLEGTLFWDGSFLPIACAVALLGPAAVAAITVASELSVYRIERYRLRVLPLNLFGTLAPNMAAAWVIGTAAANAEGAALLAMFVVVISGAILGNIVLVTTLAGILYGQPVIARLKGHARYAPAVAVNVVLALGAVAAYRVAGLIAALFVIAGVFVFAYVAKRISTERTHRREIEDLAASRGRLVAQLLEAEDRERRVLAQRLHDDAVQSLIAARQDVRDAIEGNTSGLVAAMSSIDCTVRALRETIVATHPSILERVGLSRALQAIAEETEERTGRLVRLNVDDNAVRHHQRLLFSVARELIANAAKHANADVIDISLAADAEYVHLSVTDDGSGFDPDGLGDIMREGHIGLASATERVEALGGSLAIASGPNGGTCVTASIPREERLAAAGPTALAASADGN
jgi:two-component system NarL family sensor kinase